MERTSHRLARHESGSQQRIYDTNRSLRLSALSAVDRCIVRRYSLLSSDAGTTNDRACMPGRTAPCSSFTDNRNAEDTFYSLYRAITSVIAPGWSEGH